MIYKCDECGREWPDDSEQAACIRLHQHCLVCRNQKELDVVAVEEKIYDLYLAGVHWKPIVEKPKLKHCKVHNEP